MNTSQVIGNIILEASHEVPEVTIISEKNNKVTGTGIIQTLEDENRNGRIYQLKDMKPEVEGDRIQKELIPTGNMRGHDGHPSSTELSIQSVINPTLCSVKYKRIWLEGNEIHADFCGTNNELGKAFNADLLDGDRPSFSLRALGSVDRERNGKCYVRNIRIITWDRVIYPSHKRAYMSGLVTSKNEAAIMEAAGYNRNDFELTNGKKALNEGVLIPIINQQVVDYIKHESANIKSIINTFDTLYESAIIVNGGKQVQLSLTSGDKMVINLEQYIADEIMNYCYKN
jgi:hypothetical protein